MIVPPSGSRELGPNSLSDYIEISDQANLIVCTVKGNAFDCSRYIHTIVFARKNRFILLQVDHGSVNLPQALTFINIEVVPLWRFGTKASTFINTDVVTQLTKLPNHFGTGNRKQKRRSSLMALHRGLELTDRVAAFHHAISLCLVAHPLFIMTLHVSHQMRLFPATSLVGRPGQIGFSAIVIAHNGLREIVIHIAPKQNSVIGQLLFFRIIAQMLENNQSIVLVIPHRVGHPFEKGYSGGIVGTGPGTCTIRGIGKALGKVEAKSVNPKLVHPKSEDAVDQGLGMHTFVIKIVAPLSIRILHVVVLVVPGIIRSGLSVFKIHLKQGR